MSTEAVSNVADTHGLASPLFWVYVIGLTLSVFFVFRYSRYSNWRSTLAGRAIMILSTNIAVVLLYAAIVRLLDPPPSWRLGVGVLLLGTVDVALFNLTRVLIRYQGGFRRGREEGTELDRSVYEQPEHEGQPPQKSRTKKSQVTKD